jgi:hypothetical protein
VIDQEAPMPLQTPVPVMDYNTPRADQVPRRKYIAVIVIAALLAALLLSLLAMRMGRGAPAVRLAAPVAAPPPPPVKVTAAVQAARNSIIERRFAELLNNPLSAATIVYEEEPVAAKKLRGDSSGVINQQAERDGNMSAYWDAFVPPAYRASGFWENNVTNQSHDALLFSSRLISPGGNERLVMLEMDVKLAPVTAPKDEHHVAINRQLKYRICDTSAVAGMPRVMRSGPSLKIIQEGDHNVIPIKWIDGTLRAARAKEHELRFFAGQADPKDTSHFTVEYELGGAKNVIDGWLTDDDYLRIVPRGGAVDKSVWRIEAK